MKPGSIFFHPQFQFHDGTRADKLVFVLGGTSSKIVTAKTTSQEKHRRLDHGCQASDRFPGFLMTVGCCFLKQNTWLCFNEFYEFNLSQLQAVMGCGKIYRIGEVAAEITRDAQACAVSSDDISSDQEAIVRNSFIKVA